MGPNYLIDETSLAAFLRAFEDTTLPKPEWTHGAHVAMGTVYLRRYGTEALPRVREAIRRFNAAKGGPPTAFHETLTVFWLCLIAEHLRGREELGELEAVRFTAAVLGASSGLFRSYYSFDVVKDEAARKEWVAPDLIEVTNTFAATPSLPE